jgi:hypothetical protein
MMPDPAVPHKIRLERRTFGELLTNPSKESLEILKKIIGSERGKLKMKHFKEQRQDIKHYDRKHWTNL